MITVAIIGLLAATAIPSYQRYVLRAKQAESYTVINTIRNAQFAHYALYDCFVNTLREPAGALNPAGMPWTSVNTPAALLPCSDPSPRSFEDIGVKPNNARVYYQYQCSRVLGAGAGVTHDFACAAIGDIDGDTDLYELVYGTDHDGDGQTPPSPGPSGAPSLFPHEPIRVSPAVF